VAAVAEYPPRVDAELHALAIEHDCGVVADAGGAEAPRELPAPQESARRLRRRGIGNDTTVVFYGEGVQFGVYAWWVFRYCGHENVCVLDGRAYRWAAEDGHSLPTNGAATC